MDKYEMFVTAVEKENISKAAESLNYTQSGVSYAIAALEKEVGFQLLKRQKSGVTLTPKGQHFYPFILDIVNSRRRLDQEIDAMQHVIAGTLRLGSFPSVTSVWLPTLMRKFITLYPDVRFEIFDGDYEEETSLLLEEKIDCAFVPQAACPPSLAFLPLYNDHLYAVMPKGHPLTKKKAVLLDDFLEYPLIIQNTGNDAAVQSLMTSTKKAESIAYTLRDDASIMMLVEQGLGVSFIAGLYKKICPADIVFRPFKPEGDRLIGLALSDKKHLTAATKTFVEFVESFDLERLSV